MLNKEVLEYILKFLCGSSRDVLTLVDYTSDPTCSSAKIVIIQSAFFDKGIYGTLNSEPRLPLALIDDIPILFGKPYIEKNGQQIIIHADLVASTYYLISRYEEMIKPNVRDQHGRFPGKDSLPYRAGFIDRPVVEEYGRILRSCLREIGVDIDEPSKGFSHIFLTHDVDCPWEQFTIYSASKRIVREIIREHKLTFYPIKNMIGNPRNDPWYTFNLLIDADKTVHEAECIYFLKSTEQLSPQDYFPYIEKKGMKKLLLQLKKSKSLLGYHVSYAAGRNTDLVSGELRKLREICEEKIAISRNHFLASLEPCDFYALIQNGISDDFTMGYADVAGFRLGTCKAVRWIDPEKKCLTKLVLHPLTMMDCSLTDEKYMGLDEQSSQYYGKSLIEYTAEFGGEVSLLWHNNVYVGNKNSVFWKNYLFFLDLLKKITTEYQ